MIDIHDATIQWARDRKLIQNGKAATQALKLGSEMSELAINLLLYEDIRDDIGDMMVVMTILAALHGDTLLDIIETTEVSTSTRHAPFPLLVHHVGDLQDNVIKNAPIAKDLANAVFQLGRIANSKNHTLLDCWTIAYKDIKDRKGFLNSEGCFIKDTDPEYKLMLEKADKTESD